LNVGATFMAPENAGSMNRTPTLGLLREAGYPVLEIALPEKEGIGELFYIAEFATALSGYLMGINPFNQPGVDKSKRKTGEILERSEEEINKPSRYVVSEKGMVLDYGSSMGEGKIGEEELEEVLKLIGRRDIAGVYGGILWLAKEKGRDYAAILPYINESENLENLLKGWRGEIRERLKVGTIAGIGPGFQHSLLQLFQEGPNKGIFTFMRELGSKEELRVPEAGYTFGHLVKAQARGTEEALSEAGRMCLRIDVERMDRRILKGLERIFAETGKVLEELENLPAIAARLGLGNVGATFMAPENAGSINRTPTELEGEPLSEYPVRQAVVDYKGTNVFVFDFESLFEIEPIREATPSRMSIELKVKPKSKGVFTVMERIVNVAREEKNLDRIKFAFVSSRRDVSREVMEEMLRDYMSGYGLSAEVVGKVIDKNFIIDEKELRREGGIAGIMRSAKISTKAVFSIINEALLLNGRADGNGTEIKIITDRESRWKKDGTRGMMDKILWVVLNPAKEGEVISTSAGLVVAIEGKVSEWLIDFIKARYPKKEAERLIPRITRDGKIILPATPVDEKYLEGIKAEERIYKVQA